ncbi:uncharacterized protein LOC131879580 [Tigriopus californicus]|uniref:uncharacterized protein LOC131879580 n=1 Tax=Tigriopus californicus TaxID=6832 RepID=UPI0027DA157B|nr:uncharacterized protein LOC131879580 [Tigriopus californicus]|eukprot:TCALIF_03308-PA protein Name:"Protein of unknown function" AED:0.11 eAED:0.11 QI:0/1/0/1/0/0.5/2/0/140
MSGNQGRQLNRRRGSSTDKSGQEDAPDLTRPNVPDELLDFMKGIAIKQPVPEEPNAKSPLRRNVRRAQPKVNTNINRSHKNKQPMRVKASLIVHDTHENVRPGSPTSDSENSETITPLFTKNHNVTSFNQKPSPPHPLGR